MHYRLGIPVKVVGAPLRAYDSRRWPQQPHLSVSLAYLRDIFAYLHQHDIGLYRLAGQLAPYLTHPDLPHFHRQLDECATELAALGDLERQYQLRLTLHPAFYIQLNSPHPAQVTRSHTELCAAAALLDGFGVGKEGVIVIHVGSAFGDVEAGKARFVTAYHHLPAAVRARLALENDDRTYDIHDLHWIHKRTGIRLVFDVLHHRCHNRTRLPMTDALHLALASWPPDEQPKIHYSSPRTELRRRVRGNGLHLQLPLPNQHSDFVNAFEFVDFMRMARAANTRAFDIMLEVKAKELALVRLRQQVAQYAPELMSLLR